MESANALKITTENNYNQDVEERWQKYRDINSNMPDVRVRELTRTLDLIAAKPGERILEAGTGSTYLTFPIARSLLPGGELVTADINRRGLQELDEKNVDNLPITTYLYSEDYLKTPKFSEPQIQNNSFDTVASLATFHHFDNREVGTGEKGRINLLTEAFSKLKEGGRLVIGDVCHGTNTQKYFDAVDDPIHFYPMGHPHDFFDPSRLETVLKMIGYQNINVSVEQVPWNFESKEHAMYFMHNLHNARCTPEESFGIVEDVLGFNKVGDHYEMGWQLSFLQATK